MTDHASSDGFFFMPEEGLDRTSDYRIRMDPDGAVRIRFNWKQPVMANCLPDQTWIAPGSFMEMSVEVRIPRADQDRYAAFDWGSFDPGPGRKADGPTRLRRPAERRGPAGPRLFLHGSVSLGFRFHHIPGPPRNFFPEDDSGE